MIKLPFIFSLFINRQLLKTKCLCLWNVFFEKSGNITQKQFQQDNEQNDLKFIIGIFGPFFCSDDKDSIGNIKMLLKFQLFIIFYLQMSQFAPKLIFFCIILLNILAQGSSCPRGEIKVYEKCISCQVYRDVNMNDDLKAYAPWNSCPCIEGYAWSPTKLKCVPQEEEWPFYHKQSPYKQKGPLDQKAQNKKIQNLDQTVCPNSMGFILINQDTNPICINCLNIPFASNYAQNQKCYCAWNFQWKGNNCKCPDTFYIYAYYPYCLSCYGRGVAQRPCKTCTFPFVRSALGCILCPTLANSGNTTCCAPRYAFDYNLAKCVCAKGHVLSGNKCIPCTPYSNDCINCINNYIYDGYQCVLSSNLLSGIQGLSSIYGCPLGSTYKYDPISNQIIRCACSGAAFYYQNGDSCISCSQKLPQNVILGDCQGCVATAGFYRGSVECIYCPGVANSYGTATPYSCDCIPGYYWNTNAGKCQCDYKNGNINGPDGTCINCYYLPYSSWALKDACVCSAGYYWNPQTFSCDFDITYIGNIFVGGKFISCNRIPGSPGFAMDMTSCACFSPGYIWNYGTNRCECNDNQGSIKTPGSPPGVCWNCLDGFLFNKNAYNGLSANQKCVCINGYVWDSALLLCGCPTGMIVSGISCVSCTSIKLPTGTLVSDCNSCNNQNGFILVILMNLQYCVYCPNQRGVLGDGTCSCPEGQIWMQTYGGCVCDYTGGYITINVNNTGYTCVLCPYLTIDQQCLPCGYSPLNMEVNGLICTDCSKDPNAIITSDKRCVCKNGFSWSETVYPFRCAPSFSGGSYMDGSTQPPKYQLCSTTKAPADCLSCNTLKGYLSLPGIDQCLSCQTVKNATGKVIYGFCECKTGFVWNPQTYSCAQVNCTIGFIYDFSQQTCTCDPVRSITLNKKCFYCARDPNSNGFAVPDPQAGAVSIFLGCSCKPTFTWLNGACVKIACNTTNSIWLGGICYKCPVTAFSTGAARNSTCVCTNRYTWKSNITGGECHCNLMTNYINSNNSCMPCPSANNSMGIADGEGGCLCRNNFRWDPSGACLCSFSSIGVSGYLSKGNCILCMTNNDLNYEGTVTNNTCNCKKGFTAVRSAKGAITCQCLSPAVKAQGQCITCPKNGNSTGVYSTFGSCICFNGYIWNPQKNTCFCDASVFAYITPNGTCFSCMNAADPNLSGYVVNGACSCINGFTFATTNTGGSCQCTQLLSSNGICYSCPANSVSDENGGCLCLNSYVWSANTLQCLCDESVSSFILPDGGCFVCTSAQDPNFDGTLTNGMCNCINGFSVSIDSYRFPSCICLLVIYPNGICSFCPTNSVSLGISDGNGGCLCKNQYTWDSVYKGCFCKDGPSFVLPNGLCMTCGSVGSFTTGPGADASSCICAAGLTWNPDFAMCDCGSNAAILVNGNTYVCVTCDGNIKSDNTRPTPYTCGCLTNSLIWNNVTGKCDCGPDATDNNGVCIDCTSISFAAGINPDIAGTCTCNFQGSIWSASDSKCICSDSSSVVFMIGKGQYACQACNPSISAASPRLSPTSCTCPTGTFWSDNVGCVCTYSNSAAFYNGNSVTCIVCDGTINAAGVAAGGRNCICMGTLIWNFTTLSCGCNSTSAMVTINGRPTCVDCLSLNYASTPVIALTNCTCLSTKLVWYPQGYCGCPNSTFNVVMGNISNITCLTCNQSIYSVGKVHPTSSTCICIAQMLTFNNGVCDCGSDSAISVYIADLSGSYSYNCVYCNDPAQYMNGKRNITTCNCTYPILVYNTIYRICRCKDPMTILYVNGRNASCVGCKGQYVGTPNGIDTCSCIMYGLEYTPSSTGGSCNCPPNSILLPSFTCSACPDNTNSLTPYQCLCPTDSIWSIYRMACLICGTTDILNSQTTGGSSLACKCSFGFIWDVMTLSCIVPCTDNNASCMDCSMQQAKGTAFSLNATASLKLAGWNTTLSALNGAFTNYNSIKGYQCPCMIGNSWDSVRLRCYDRRLI